ncbi:MAG: FlgO family outer membrane protein, partial [Colwellia sp.]|nr:FlgO family outer membrane protein [Colwellia sp.]
EGDFISSRDFNDLSSNIPIRYIVTGNLVKHQGGYLVNARVVGITSKAVVASAQSFIPAHVAKALLSSKPASDLEKKTDQVPLVQG